MKRLPDKKFNLRQRLEFPDILFPVKSLFGLWLADFSRTLVQSSSIP